MILGGFINVISYTSYGGTGFIDNFAIITENANTPPNSFLLTENGNDLETEAF